MPHYVLTTPGQDPYHKTVQNYSTNNVPACPNRLQKCTKISSLKRTHVHRLSTSISKRSKYQAKPSYEEKPLHTYDTYHCICICICICIPCLASLLSSHQDCAKTKTSFSCAKRFHTYQPKYYRDGTVPLPSNDVALISPTLKLSLPLTRAPTVPCWANMRAREDMQEKGTHDHWSRASQGASSIEREGIGQTSMGHYYGAMVGAGSESGGCASKSLRDRWPEWLKSKKRILALALGDTRPEMPRHGRLWLVLQDRHCYQF
ncbi:hypothetical protein B0T19DRAFT_402868 [Cercophora scortea]|uniref:Uncharacterized protein n=1 Tax=Cercophora scortea TaxID=314031 RepID=A0AAE0MB68_9PEZI|nr:hypothetical protein B0T19DRAFT_402868 [Cercophora scortea]